MSRQSKLNLLADILGWHYSAGSEYVFHCKFCNHHKKKLSVNIEKNKFKCWICDTSGNDIRYLIRRFGSRAQTDQWDVLTNRVNLSGFDNLFEEEKEPAEETLKLPNEFVSLANSNLPYSALAPKQYLRARGITKEDILKWKIGYCSTGEYEGRIVIPSFNKDGYVNYFIGRSYGDKFPRYKNPPASKDIVFNHLYIDWTKDIILVEGAFDAIVAGSNAIPILGSTLREEGKLFQEIVKNNSTIYMALDPDMDKKARNLIKKLLSYNIKIHKIDVLPYADVGEMTKEEFANRKEAASFLNKEDYLLYEAINSL